MSLLHWKSAGKACFRSVWWNSLQRIRADDCFHRFAYLSIDLCSWSSKLRHVFLDADGSQYTGQPGISRLYRILQMPLHLYGKQESPCFCGKLFHITFLQVRILLSLLVRVRSRGEAFLRWYWISYLSACWSNNSSPTALRQNPLLALYVPTPVPLCIPVVR